METTHFYWQGYNWQTQQPWGNIHPDYPNYIYNKAAVNINNNELELKILKGSNNNYFIGLVSTCFLDYGIYEFEVKMPQMSNAWTALWMYSSNSWPPEIDIVEGYSGVTNYKKRTRWVLKPNVHYGNNPINHRIVGARCVSRLLLPNPMSNFIRYMCYYKERYILITYNRIPVYFVFRNKIMNDFHKHHKMIVVMNFHPGDNFKESDLNNSEMIIKSFKYRI